VSDPLRLAFFTGNRAEFGLIWPIVRGLAEDRAFSCRLFAGGMHLVESRGNTVAEVCAAGAEADIPVIRVGAPPEFIDAHGVVEWTAAFMPALSEALAECDPAAVFVYGDRIETFAAATAAFLRGWVTVHLGGGHITSGGLWDDSLRHAITKLAHVHFVSCEKDAEHVLGLHEEPWRIHVIGSPAVERHLGGQVADMAELSAAVSAGRPQRLGGEFLLFAFHPDTTDAGLAGQRARLCLDALAKTGRDVLLTGPNGDLGSDAILAAIHDSIGSHPQFFFRQHLGARLYLGAVAACAAVVGNSSSGLLETPLFRKPAVDIGLRQRDRIAAANVVHVPFDLDKIVDAIHYVRTDPAFARRLAAMENPFDHGRPSRNIARVLPGLLRRGDIKTKRG